MTDDELALLRNINANPDDDLPRLVYADWLDEHDRPIRAEFIRVQCELAVVEAAREAMKLQVDRDNYIEYSQLKRRIRTLKKRNVQLLTTPEFALEFIEETRPRFPHKIQRGFLSEMMLENDDVFRNSTYLDIFSNHIVKPTLIGHTELATVIYAPRSMNHVEIVCNNLGSLTFTNGYVPPPKVSSSVWRDVSDFFGITKRAKYYGSDRSITSQIFYDHFLAFSFLRLTRLKTRFQLDNAEFRVFCEKLNAPRLEEWLNASAKLNDDSLCHLSKAVFAPTLQTLGVTSSQVTAEGLQQLTPEKFPKLKKIIVGQHTPASNDLAALRALHPQIEYVG
jgi:uncharacterized protein (TIGR02996 family)